MCARNGDVAGGPAPLTFLLVVTEESVDGGGLVPFPAFRSALCAWAGLAWTFL